LSVATIVVLRGAIRPSAECSWTPDARQARLGKGNDDRLIARLQYQAGVLAILFGTHAEYDKVDAENI
jgi:mRNA-degrading endonuclease HigB of HigAB toxin-antitoxin module